MQWIVTGNQINHLKLLYIVKIKKPTVDADAIGPTRKFQNSAVPLPVCSEQRRQPRLRTPLPLPDAARARITGAAGTFRVRCRSLPSAVLGGKEGYGRSDR